MNELILHKDIGYDLDEMSGIYSVALSDEQGNHICTVYGSTIDECSDRADTICIQSFGF